MGPPKAAIRCQAPGCVDTADWRVSERGFGRLPYKDLCDKHMFEHTSELSAKGKEDAHVTDI